MGVPQKSMVETEILKFVEAEEKIEKINRESELKRRDKGENGERYFIYSFFVPLCPPLSSTSSIESFVLLSILSMAFKPLSSTKSPILLILLMWAQTF